MPNQFFSRGYYGYPYPQQNNFPPADAYPQYPFMNAAPQPMPGRPYTPNPGYQDPAAYFPRQQYDYPYPQYGFAQQGYAQPVPYEQPQPMAPSWMQPSVNPVGPVPPAYASPMMQAPYFGYDYPQQAYPQPYQPMPQYDPRFDQYQEQARQYWQEYPNAPQQTNPYQQYGQPSQEGQYPGQHPQQYQGAQNPEGPQGYDARDETPSPRAAEKRPSKERKRPSRHDEELREARAKRRAARRESEERLRQEALKEKRIAQAKRRAAQEAAQKEAKLQQELKRQAALKQEERVKEAHINHSDEAQKPDSAIDNLVGQKRQGDDAAAAAAASIAAFHKAAKSVNEINLNEVTQALKPEESSAIGAQPAPTMQSLAEIIDNENGKKEAETSNVTEDATAKRDVTATSEIDLPGISEKKDGSSDKASTDETLSMPKADDLFVMPDTSKDDKKEQTSEKSADATAPKEAASKNADKDDTDKESDATAEDQDKKTPEATEGPAQTEGEANAAKPSLSPLAIVGLVFGIVAIALAAFAPLFNFLGYAALIVGALALILSAVGLGTMKSRKKTGKPAAIAGVVCGILAIVIAIVLHLLMPANSSTGSYSTTPNSTVLGYVQNSSSSASSSAYTSGNTDTTASSDSYSSDSGNGDQATGSSSPQTNNAGSASTGTTQGSPMASMDVTPTGSHENLSVGSAVNYSNGLTVSVDKVETGLTTTSGSKIVCVTVTYKNNGSSSLDYNSFDWKVEDTNGTLRTYAIYPSGENELNSGELSPGASVTGNLYFEAPVSKIIYEANYWNSDGNASWKA